MATLPPSAVTPFAALNVSDEFLSFYNQQRDAAALPATSPLHVAVLSGDRTRIAALLASGRADPRARDQAGHTALHHAALLGHLDICSLLIANGADVDAVACADGSTPLHKAAQGGHAAVVRMLLTHGALHPVLNSRGESAYDVASRLHHVQVAVLLSDRAAQVEVNNAQK